MTKLPLALSSIALGLAVCLAVPATAFSAPEQAGKAVAEVGKPAPDFSLPDLAGKPVKLSTFKGKRVVLEWFNPDCPFVKHAHGKGPLKDMAARYTKQGVIWLAVNSGAPGKQGAGRERNQGAVKEYGLGHPVLLDEGGQVGRQYGAKTTPHLYIIDEKGVLVYRGGLDNMPLGEADGPPVNHVDAAFEDLKAGRPVKQADTKSYGCSVKYGS